MPETCAPRLGLWIAGLLPAVAASMSAVPGVRGGEAADRARRAEESRWVRAARGGDQDAFRRLVERHADEAFETALRIVRRREEAEEVTQDAFVRAWRALPGFREEARFSTWLYRIVTRRAIDAARAVHRRQLREPAAEPAAIENRPAPVEPVPRASLRRLEIVLGELDPVPRAVVTLFYLRDQPVREIAEILDVPEGTVKTHLHRSRAALRRAWERHERREGDHELPRL